MVLENILTLSIQDLIYTAILPFVITFAILWGVLEAIKLFNKKVNIVLALAITLVAAYSGLFTLLSNYFLQFGALFGVATFVIVFVVGVIAWAAGRGREFYYESLRPEEKSKKIGERIEKLYKEMKKARDRGDEGKMRALAEEIRRLELEREVARRGL
ncbi:MAG: hypothetical protein QMD12_03350 [Candidatus Aenigmarchaeota archaeon]|nr:hypothetical protein [Candidatus Aenigmarchaeota archaeon]